MAILSDSVSKFHTIVTIFGVCFFASFVQKLAIYQVKKNVEIPIG